MRAVPQIWSALLSASVFRATKNRSRRFPKRTWRYPLVGFVLGFGAPAGLCALRWFVAGLPEPMSWLRGEVYADALTYFYLGISTTAVFVALGYVLGHTADALEASSNTDPLTGLSNRRHLCRVLQREAERSARYGSPFAFLLIDVDRLKRINDELGHDAGDRALRLVARSLLENCRATDIAARWGGDEFAVLAPGSTADDASNLAERIHKTLARNPPASRVCVSIGVTDLEHAGSADPDAVQAAADKALYEAKSAGRDRTVISDWPPSSMTARPS